MAELKTKPNNRSVEKFLGTIADEHKRRDAGAVLEIMSRITGAEPRMWGDRIIGFGNYHFCYGSGREGDWFVVGLSPRKACLSLYLMAGLDGNEGLLKKLGKHQAGKGCLYIKRLDDIHLPTLKELIKQSVKRLAATTR